VREQNSTLQGHWETRQFVQGTTSRRIDETANRVLDGTRIGSSEGLSGDPEALRFGCLLLAFEDYSE